MADMRSCIKTGCRWPAAATLSYRYSTAEVWLTDLGDHHPATHDLCPHHADSLTVPNGWTVVDTRQPMEAPREPSAAEIVERATKLRHGVTAMLHAAAAPPAPERPPSRYSALLETLPRYAPDGTEDAPGNPLQEASADAGPHVPAQTVHTVPRRGAHEAVAPEPPEEEPAPAGPEEVERASRAAAVRVVAGLTRELAPVIREMAADLAGPVVGTIEIDLDDDPSGPSDADIAAPPPESVEMDADNAPAPEVPETAESRPRQGAMVFQLPLREDDSSVE